MGTGEWNRNGRIAWGRENGIGTACRDNRQGQEVV